jgi:phage tail sheath protein FI
VGIAASYCETRRSFYIVDPPVAWTGSTSTPNTVVTGMATSPDPLGTRSKNAAIFWPRLMEANPFNNNNLEPFAACGAVAGVFARTDEERGVWKAPAGLDAVLKNVPDLEYRMTDGENGLLNPLGVNALRIKVPAGRVVYGARTLQGDDRLGAEYKYIPVCRLALYIEESAYRGTQWAVFEPNDEPLWAQIRLNLGTFMHDLFRKGAFQGKTRTDAYFVKCDSETTTQSDINLGIVNIVLGFAPLKPSEFVVISLQQMAGNLEA